MFNARVNNQFTVCMRSERNKQTKKKINKIKNTKSIVEYVSQIRKILTT